MDNILTISQIIKRYIKLRGYSIQGVADKLGVNYKTFDGILNRDAVDAKMLLRLANLLGMDLCWMAQLYENKRPISFLEQYQMTRMNNELREGEKRLVLARLDQHILNNPCSISEVKKELLRDFGQLFYLLDVLLPEDYIIRVAIERDREKYYCMPACAPEHNGYSGWGRNTMCRFYEGQEMLKQIIFERKAEL